MTNSARNRTLAACAAVVVLAYAAGLMRSASWRHRDPGTLELCLGDNPTTLDPALIKDVSGGRLAALLYPNLLRYGADDKLACDAAESWNISPDGLVYTFNMRQGAKFSDGSPMEAADAAASFERAMAPDVATPRPWVLDRIKGAAAYHAGAAGSIEGLKVIDARTLEITLEQPCGIFPALLTMPSAAILPRATPRRPFWGVETLPTAGGPYRVESLVPDVSVTLQANPRYFGAAPTVQRIRYRVIRNSFAVVSEFRQGRLDIIEIPDSFDRFFRDDPRRRPFIASVEGPNTYYLGFNCTHAPFDNRDFRRAVCMAIDRAAIIDGVLHGRATAAKGPIPAGLSGYDDALRGIPFDPAAARAAFAKAATGASMGASTGAGALASGNVKPLGIRPLSLLVMSSSPDTIIVAEALAGQLKAAGLSVEVTPREKATFKSLLSDGDFDMVYYSWVADYADGGNFLVPLFKTSADRGGGNYTAYSSAAVDAILERAAVTPDEAARARLYREAAAIVVVDAPRAFLWHAKRVVVRQPWVTGYEMPHIFSAERFEGTKIFREAVSK